MKINNLELTMPDLLKSIEQKDDLKVAVSRGTLSIQQTQRNNIKREVLSAFYDDMKTIAEKNGLNVYLTREGVALALNNERVESQIMINDKEGNYQTRMSILFDIKIKNLDFDPEYEEFDYLNEIEAKEAKAEEAEKAKQIKIKKDAEDRAQKLKIREQQIAEMMVNRNKGNTDTIE